MGKNKRVGRREGGEGIEGGGEGEEEGFWEQLTHKRRELSSEHPLPAGSSPQLSQREPPPMCVCVLHSLVLF